MFQLNCLIVGVLLKLYFSGNQYDVVYILEQLVELCDYFVTFIQRGVKPWNYPKLQY